MDVYAESIVKEGVLLSKSKRYLDFGPGFYTTPDRNFAIDTAINRTKRFNRFTRKEHRNPAVIVFECDEAVLKQLDVKVFDKPSSLWGQFVLSNRIQRDDIRNNYENNFDYRYDCVIGPTADGKNGAIDTLVDLIDHEKVLLSKIRIGGIVPSNSKNWGEQHSFHTEESLRCLKIIETFYPAMRREKYE